MNENPTDSLPPIPPTPPPQAPALDVSLAADERNWALFAHLSALAGCLLTGWWFGMGSFIGPLIIWLVKKDTMPFVDDQAKEALNFNITFAIFGTALLVLTIVTLGIGALLTVPAGIIGLIAWLVFVVIATIKASEGVRYRYPVSIRLIK